MRLAFACTPGAHLHCIHTLIDPYARVGFWLCSLLLTSSLLTFLPFLLFSASSRHDARRDPRQLRLQHLQWPVLSRPAARPRPHRLLLQPRRPQGMPPAPLTLTSVKRGHRLAVHPQPVPHPHHRVPPRGLQAKPSTLCCARQGAAGVTRGGGLLSQRHCRPLHSPQQQMRGSPSPVGDRMHPARACHWARRRLGRVARTVSDEPLLTG